MATDDVLKRIAAAFGCEPDDDNDLVEAVKELVRERDDARAEVSRLQEDRDKWRDRYHAMRTDVGLSGDVEDEITCAYRRGAEAMREACAIKVEDHWRPTLRGGIIEAIRALPIPEEP